MTDRASRRLVFRLGVGAKHVEMRTRNLIAAGLDPDAARERAIEQFGDLRAVRAECVDIDYEKERAVRRTNYLSDLRQDVLYALVTVGNPARTGGLSDGSPRNDIVSYPVFADVRDQTR